jgi:hypothetical protein
MGITPFINRDKTHSPRREGIPYRLIPMGGGGNEKRESVKGTGRTRKDKKKRKLN